MAIGAATEWQLRPSATANGVNGGGFNRSNVSFFTDFTVTAGTGNTSTPEISSVSYSFVAADAGAWAVIPVTNAGADAIPGRYLIASVNVGTGKATLTAGIGTATINNPNTGIFESPNTAAGISTVGTPTGMTIGFDFSDLNAAVQTATDYASVGSSTTITSAAAGFRAIFVGNFIKITTTGTGAFGVIGWYELVTYTNTTTMTTDRTTNTGTAMVAASGNIGGGLDMGTAFDAWGEQLVAGNIAWVLTGAYTQGVNFSIAAASASATAPINMRGHFNLRGDVPTEAQRPTVAQAAFVMSGGQYFNISDLFCTGTAASESTVGIGGQYRRNKFLNTSTTAARNAISSPGGTSSSEILNCEAISQNGNGISNATSSGRIQGCTARDSAIGINLGGTSCFVLQNNVYACSTGAISMTAAGVLVTIASCTLYGSEAKTGTGILIPATAFSNSFYNNIIYGFTTGITQTTAQLKSNRGRYNCFSNNTTDVSNYSKDMTDIAVNPAFVSMYQITGATATTSGSVLTQSGGDFSAVTDNQDFVYISAGTGKTVGKYLITSHSATTITLNNSPGTSAVADGVWTITLGHNLAITGSI